MDGGMHKGAMVNIQQATQPTKGTSNLQRVNREEPTNSKEPTTKRHGYNDEAIPPGVCGAPFV